MKKLHTISMNTVSSYFISMSKRITISLPNSLHRALTRSVAKGKISQFVSKAIQQQLLKDKLSQARGDRPSVEEEFLALRKDLPKFSQKEIKAAIERGRL